VAHKALHVRENVRIFLQLFRFPIQGLRTGQIYGVPVSQNFFAWLPFLVLLAFLPLLIMLLIAAFVVCFVIFFAKELLTDPLGTIFGRGQCRWSARGIRFHRGWGRVTIPWSDIREVIFHRDDRAPTVWFRIISDVQDTPADGFIALPPQFKNLEEELTARCIPWRQVGDDELVDPC
jgi:hypothetical protein